MLRGLAGSSLEVFQVYLFSDFFSLLLRPPDKSVKLIFFCIYQPKHVVGTQKNCLDETVLLSTQNTCVN